MCTQRSFCGNISCRICFERSYISYDGTTDSGKRKVDCWDYELNNDVFDMIYPQIVAFSSHKKYWNKCDICKHLFESSVCKITRRDQWCPYCANKQLCNNKECNICFEKSYASHDGLTSFGKRKIECWDPERNDKTPRDVFKSTHTKYFHNCDKCGHSFNGGLKQITLMNSWCPYCCEPSQQLCEDENCNNCFEKSYASYDGLTKYGKKKVECWDSERNDKTPRKVFKSSHSKYWHKCDKCKHSFGIRLCDITRETKNHWCPYCCKPSHKLCDDKNCDDCFQKSYASYKGQTPSGNKKIDYWDYKKNKKSPRDISKSSNKKYWHKCDKCKHSFYSILNNITGKNYWCPKCVNKTELKLLTHLKETYPEYTIIHQYRVEWCKSETTNKYYPYDFYIKELNTVVPLDGRQHFIQVRNWASPETQRERDIYKMKCAIENGCSVVRLYQEDVYHDKNNWAKKLDKAIQKIKNSDKPKKYYCSPIYRDHFFNTSQ